MTRFQSDSWAKPEDTKPKEPLKYILENLSVNGSSIHYISQDFGAEIEVEEMTLESPVIAWDDPELSLAYSLSLGSGGEVAGSFHLNQQTLDYTQFVEIEILSINLILPYLMPYLNVKKIDGVGFLSMTTSGNINDQYGMAMKGLYLREERFDSTDSFSQLIIRNFNGYTTSGQPPDSAFILSSKANPVILLINYIEKMQEVVVMDNYKVNHLKVLNSALDFVDHTLLEQTTLKISQLSLDISDINSDSSGKLASGSFSTRIQKDGWIIAEFSFCHSNRLILMPLTN